MSGAMALSNILRRIDGRGYRAYKDIAGAYALGSCTLFVDHVQGDPFAAPSKLRLRVPMTIADLPEELFDTRVREVAFADYLSRQARRVASDLIRGRRGSGKSGEVFIDAGGQEILERAAVVIDQEWVELRLSLGLPARGRSVLGHEARALLLEDLPKVAARSLTLAELDIDEAEGFVDCADNQAFIRESLASCGLVGFIADGSVLPRESGASDRPMSKHAVPWSGPDSLRVTFDLPNPLPDGQRSLSGTGIPLGVTLIVGGGYHGKSTVLKALERAVYPHIPGDGREYVVTDHSAVKIRAEDGRSVVGVDISAFINGLPGDRSTRHFESDDASGSTSQAANIMEALEVGAASLLLDEDTSATNFMVRDARMQALVARHDEPITPFVDRIRELYEAYGVSTVLVMGGSGDYFEPADTVIRMRAFEPSDATTEAKKIAGDLDSKRERQIDEPLRRPTPRIPLARSLDASRGRRDIKIDARGLDEISFGTSVIDMRQVEQLVDVSQTRAIGAAIELSKRFMDGERTLKEALDALEAHLDRKGLDALDPWNHADRHPGNFARPRRFEIAAALNRLRTLRVLR